MSLMEFLLGHLEPWLWLVIAPHCFSHFFLVVIGFSEDEHNLVNALYYVPKFLFEPTSFICVVSTGIWV